MMFSRHDLLRALTAATATIFVLLIIVLLMTMMRQGSGALTGRLIDTGPTTYPTVFFGADKVERGFQAPPDTHVIFTMPASSPPIRIVDAIGGARIDDTVRFWGYCYSGQEDSNKTNGLLGRQLYNGRFFYSTAELRAQGAVRRPANQDLLGIRQSTLPKVERERTSEIDVLEPGQTCYLMSEDASDRQMAIVIGIDPDGDTLNSGLEATYGTKNDSVDTDSDGLADGIEVFGAQKTNPLEPDSDHDGILDGIEDANQNGEQDPGETSSVRADTDGDGLCDGPVMMRTVRGGEQKNAGCPEWSNVTTSCTVDADKVRVCRPMPASWLYNQGEDINANGIVDAGDAQKGIAAETDPRKADTYGVPDEQYKIQQFTAKQGFNPQNAQGTPSPSFPIPSMP